MATRATKLTRILISSGFLIASLLFPVASAQPAPQTLSLGGFLGADKFQNAGATAFTGGVYLRYRFSPVLGAECSVSFHSFSFDMNAGREKYDVFQTPVLLGLNLFLVQKGDIQPYLIAGFGSSTTVVDFEKSSGRVLGEETSFRLNAYGGVGADFRVSRRSAFLIQATGVYNDLGSTVTDSSQPYIRVVGGVIFDL